MTSQVEIPTGPRRRRFLLKRRLGSGAFGEVFLAELDTGAGFRRLVALKVLHADVAQSRPAARRMRDEARLLGRLAHRNIVGVLDLVQLNDHWAVVMEYVQGADLDAISQVLELRGEQYPLETTFSIGVAIARALDAAHYANDGAGSPMKVVHRDIKPANVRVTPDGDVKVLDFGVASANFDTREAATKAHALIGTERYMAPERLLRRGDTHSGDVYSTAATLAEMLLLEPIGVTPILPDEHLVFVSDILDRLRQRLSDQPELRDEVVTMFGRALDADPDKRPTGATLAKQLGSFARRANDGSLDDFASRIVPEVEVTLGPVGEAVDGYLDEVSSTAVPEASTTNHTLVFDDNGISRLDEQPPEGSPTKPVTLANEGLPQRAEHSSPLPARVPPPLAGEPTSEGRSTPWVAVAVGLCAVVAFLLWPHGPQTASPSTAPTSTAPTPTHVAEAPLPTPMPVAAPSDPLPSAAPAPAVIAAHTTPTAPKARPEPSSTPVDRRKQMVPHETPPTSREDLIGPGATEVEALRASEAEAFKASQAPLRRVSRAMVSVSDASSLSVRCGDVTASGTASARIREFPAGSCLIEAVHLGTRLRQTVQITEPVGLRCTVSDGALTCAP